jgi:hypothetical protein
MLESSNSYTWSALQDSDIKYNLYKRSNWYNSTKLLYFKRFNEGNYTNKILLCVILLSLSV